MFTADPLAHPMPPSIRRSPPAPARSQGGKRTPVTAAGSWRPRASSGASTASVGRCSAVHGCPEAGGGPPHPWSARSGRSASWPGR